jgi:UDP-xylose/UDP-N-acetylglucosamine transporter B4
MILGIIFLKKKYNSREYCSIIMITIGIFMCTYASSKQVSKSKQVEEVVDQFSDHFWWIVGIVLLTISLLLSSSMGIIQESLYKKYGKYPDEALFYLVIIYYCLNSTKFYIFFKLFLSIF